MSDNVMKKVSGVENANSLGAIAEIYLPDFQATPASVFHPSPRPYRVGTYKTLKKAATNTTLSYF